MSSFTSYVQQKKNRRKKNRKEKNQLILCQLDVGGWRKCVVAVFVCPIYEPVFTEFPKVG